MHTNLFNKIHVLMKFPSTTSHRVYLYEFAWISRDIETKWDLKKPCKTKQWNVSHSQIKKKYSSWSEHPDTEWERRIAWLSLPSDRNSVSEWKCYTQSRKNKFVRVWNFHFHLRQRDHKKYEDLLVQWILATSGKFLCGTLAMVTPQIL